MNTHSISPTSHHIMAKTILLVEDEFLIALREQTMLEKHGMTVLTASDGKTAVEMALAEPTLDLILMDINLEPGIDGTEAARQILAQRDLPIVFLSSHTNPEVVEKTENITAYGYIVKNSGETVLIASIKMAFKLFEAHQRLKQQDEALRESNALFQTQFELGNIGMTIASPDKAWLHVNQRLCEMLGYSEEELRQTTWSKLTHPDDLVADVAQFERMQAGEIDRYELEKRFIRKDSTILSTYLAVACHRNPDRSIRFTIGSILDITAHKQTEIALRESEERYRRFFDEDLTGDFITTPEGAILDCNPAFLRIFGFAQRSEIIGRNILEWYPDPGERLRIVVHIRTHRTLEAYETTRYRKDGSLMHVVLNFAGEFDAAGELICIRGYLFDNTTRKQAEQALRESGRQLRELNAQKDKFFSILAHDLKNPLIGFLAFAELLENDFDKQSLAERTLLTQHFHASAQMLLALLENLLTWGRLQQDRIEYSPVQFSLDPLITHTVALFAENARQKQISLINAAAAPGEVHVDINLTETVIRNLLANALKFTRPGGTVTISTAASAHGVRVTVADTGIGMPAETLRDLFRIDGRVTRQGTNGEKGTGLGLILCKEFVEKQGGTLWIESEPEQGTRVMFTLPVAA